MRRDGRVSAKSRQSRNIEETAYLLILENMELGNAKNPDSIVKETKI
jgi:hypothetical protein